MISPSCKCISRTRAAEIQCQIVSAGVPSHVKPSTAKDFLKTSRGVVVDQINIQEEIANRLRDAPAALVRGRAPVAEIRESY